MVINGRLAEGVGQQRLRAGPQDGAVITGHHGTLFLVNRCAFSGEAQRLALDDEGHGDTRSSMRKRKMRQTWAIAVSNSWSGDIVHPRGETLEDHVLGGALDGEDEGKAETLAITRVEIGEAVHFLRASAM